MVVARQHVELVSFPLVAAASITSLTVAMSSVHSAPLRITFA
jgi:hypothetical protein